METTSFFKSMVANFCWVNDINKVNVGGMHIISNKIHYHITWKSNNVDTGKMMTLEEVNLIKNTMAIYFGQKSSAYLAWKNAYNTCYQEQNKGRD